MPSTLDRLAHDAASLLSVIGAATGVKGGPRQLLASLGWDLPPGAADVGLAAVDVSSLNQSLQQLEQALASGADESTLIASFAQVLVEVEGAFTHLRAVAEGFSAAGDYLDKTQIKSQFLPRMNAMTAASRIGAASPITLLVLQFFGVVTLRTYAADPSIYQVEHVRAEVDWGGFGRLFSDPVGLLRQRYGWGTSSFDGASLVANLSALLEAIGEPVRQRSVPRRVEEQLSGRFVPEADTAPATQLIASLVRGDAASGLNAGLSFFPLRPTAPGATDGGLALNPFVHGTTQLQFPLSPTTSFEFDSTLALDSGVVLQFRAGSGLSLKSGLLGGGGVVDSVDGKALVVVHYTAPTASPQALLSLPSGGIVEVDGMSFGGGIEVLQGTLSPSFSVQLKGGHAALSTQGADSFLSSVLPSGGLDVHFDLTMRWSAAQGFSFEGSASASAEIELPLHLSLPGVEVDRLHIAVRPADGELALELSLDGGLHIGPVAADVGQVGALATLAFHDGNLGPVDLALGFKPPSGIGLSIDAQGVLTGGGFLFHDDAQGLYAGAMELSLHERITLKAFGLIATRLPDGSRGYSLLVFITAEGFQPIPLGLGFTLLGIGGMVGVNRTFDQDVLRQGLKNGTLATILFPQDPVGNATALIRALSSAFPARSGSYLLGILAKIGWFTPTLVLMDLGLILEFGSRNRLLALGHISALLPSASNDLVRLNMDAMGVIDFDAGTAAIDAVLLDSRLAHKFAITGSAALRAGFGSGPSFVLAVGGLNPHFTPPAGFPTLARVGIALSSGSNPRLVCEAYFAITSNTVQFGAHASLYAAAAGFSVEGDIGFDVLVQLVPLHFIADFDAKLQLKRGSSSLFMVEVAGELEGPQPLRISGKASFKIFWFSFSVHFDATLVDGEPPPLPPAVNLRAQLEQALTAPASWSVVRTADHPHGVALRGLPPSTTLVLDPLGRLAVQQQVAPLNTGRDIDTFGGAPVAGDRRFALSASMGSTALQSEPQQAAFAPAQYFTMSDDEKLVAPSFESMDAGCVFGSTATQFDPSSTAAAPLAYQTIVLDEAPAPDYTLDADRLKTTSRSGAAARGPVRHVGQARFRNTTATPAATLPAPRWAIMPNADGALATVDPAVRTWSDYRAALDSLNRARATWQLVPAHELE